MSTPVTVPDDVLARWSALAGRGAAPFGTGLINHTFMVEGRDGRVVLQRQHPVFAASVNDDIEAVTAHLSAKGLVTPRLVRTDDGATCVDGPDGRPWRALTFVDGRSVDKVESADRAFEAGRLAATFHAALRDFRHDYVHVRGNVHDTPKHLANLERALDEHRTHRLFADVAPVARELLAQAKDLPDFGALPRPNTHGDLKISNLLFGADGKGLCLVDLDTVGRLPIPYELGDALRSWCNPDGEDVRGAHVRPAIFDAAIDGYASAGRDLVTAAETDLLVPGLATICLELSARFLADALNESYFGWNSSKYATRGDHNLVRGLGQWTLRASVLASASHLEERVRRAFLR